jgi:Fe-S-cluster containining protein
MSDKENTAKITNQIDLKDPIVHAPWQPFVRRLIKLYAEMDAGYETTASAHGFICRGCDDSCCATRFYHHTWLETMTLIEAFAALPPSVRARIQSKGTAVVSQSAAAHARGEKIRLMCPLNDTGRCRLYAVRPMICRLHGVPHEFHRPDGMVMRGPGCKEFTGRCGHDVDTPLDRTPFYRRLAALEKNFKVVLGTSVKIKLTIAEMLTTKIPLLQSWQESASMD